jgi:hypothetical protein
MGSSLLDSSTKLVREPGWVLRLFPEAGEASGSFRGVERVRRPPDAGAGEPDRARSREIAARRARTKMRRYCAANRLNRLGTLTYRGEGCHDPFEVRADVARFFRGLRAEVVGEAFPYAWTTEWHKSGHGLHVHFAVGSFVSWRELERVWGRGFISINLIGRGRTGGQILAEARQAAGYLSKYVSKDFGVTIPGLHRYEVAQGFQPRVIELHGRTHEAVLDQASEHLGGPPAYLSFSEDWENFRGPRSVFASWNR